MNTPEHHRQLLDSALERLRASGYKLTAARRDLLEILCQTGKHLTSTEVLEQASRKENPIGRASVFRSLELLTELGIIRPTYLRAGAPNYIVMPENGHHAHIICRECSQVIEIDECSVDEMIDSLEARHNIEITGHLLELYGKCKDCD